MIFPIIQRAKNDRSVRRALPVYDNGATNGTIGDFTIVAVGCHWYHW